MESSIAEVTCSPSIQVLTGHHDAANGDDGSTGTSSVEVAQAAGGSRRRRNPVAKKHDVEGIPLGEELQVPAMDSCYSHLQSINIPELSYPKSLYTGHEPTMTASNESAVLSELLSKTDSKENQSSDTFIEAELHGFSIYRPHRPRRSTQRAAYTENTGSNQLVSLNEIDEYNAEGLLFDGFICFEDERYYLQSVPFNFLSIGGYEDLARDTVGTDIWIQTIRGRRLDVWYRLGRPAPEYERFQEYFIWTVDLAKHVVDFLYVNPGARLFDFCHRFTHWLQNTYPGNAFLASWLDTYADTDFRRMISRHATFLYSQALQIDQRYRECPLWAEIYPRDLAHIPEQIENDRKRRKAYWLDESKAIVDRRKTTVTPYVFKCFKHLPWTDLLYPQASLHTPSEQSKVQPYITSFSEIKVAGPNVEIGNVIAVAPDSTSSWKIVCPEWLALVQGVENTSEGDKLSVLWMYRPCDTACMKMEYPHPNELFLSDHCNCGDAPLYSSEVVRKPSLSFYCEPDKCDAEYFCRQQYREADAAWTTLQPDHFLCPCKIKPKASHYQHGQTVLYKLGDALLPAIVLGQDANTENKLEIRRLLFRGRDFNDPDCAPNELVYTERKVSIKSKRIARLCNIRFIPVTRAGRDDVQFPYNCDGAGDFFYLRSRETVDRKLEVLQCSWHGDFSQGTQSLELGQEKSLKALDLFCGGGNFARGLEDAGVIKSKWAVDHSNEAMHSYQANLPEGSETKLFRGSVNHFLSEALDGTFTDGLIPKIGEVDVILAGSPCQGFSMANPKKGTIQGFLNESLVASVVSHIDLYRPKYAILENVKGMAVGGEDRNVLAAVLCAIVSMGYQVQTHFLDAWSFGSPQSRSRIFISCTAPGLQMPIEPYHTHSHPSWVRSGGLGRTANGLQSSPRYQVPTPFPCILAEQAMRDLPPIDHTLGSVRYPDHREARSLTVLDRVRIASIPRYPGGIGFVGACQRGLMPQPQVDGFNWDNETRAGNTSKIWTRIRRRKLLPTIQTAPRPDDGHNGTIVHWDEHRLLTILEARRAQGYPDREVIVGSVAAQWKIVGNSVARPVAFALGLALRKAHLSTLSSADVEMTVPTR